MSAPKKRPPPSTGNLTQRKRAAVACQFCRRRKAKCDGVRPLCGFCRHHDAQCVWGAIAEPDEATPTEKEILRRLDELKNLLADHGQSPMPISENSSTHTTVLQRQERPGSPITATSQANHLSSETVPVSPFAQNSCESILKWPIFHGVVDPSDSAVESFVLETEFGHCSTDHWERDEEVSAAKHPGRGIQEDLFVPLCQKFLAHVHPRNPILEPSKLIQYAKNATEHGLAWDSSSCLVLVACSLACYTAPWQQMDSSNTKSSRLAQEDISTAETYYQAAKRRFGMLGSSLLDIHCLFFASIYEKYALNPLQAWLLVQQASSRLYVRLKRHSKGFSVPYAEGEVNEQDLEQRAFWSIYKAEYELLHELPFYPSGLEGLSRAESMFPSPPPLGTDPSQLAGSRDHQGISEERSWSFYTAEISIRRTLSDTIITLYRKGLHYWVNHVQALLRQCEDCDEQIQLWFSHLPPSIRFDPLGQPVNELSWFLKGRFLCWRGIVLRPILYYMLHRHDTQVTSPKILSLARQAVQTAADFIPRADTYHRHGGTWFVCRESFTSSLLIMGVVCRSDPDFPPPRNWTKLLITTNLTLLRWESESADLRRLRRILNQLADVVCRQKGIPPIDLTSTA